MDRARKEDEKNAQVCLIWTSTSEVMTFFVGEISGFQISKTMENTTDFWSRPRNLRKRSSLTNVQNKCRETLDMGLPILIKT